MGLYESILNVYLTVHRNCDWLMNRQLGSGELTPRHERRTSEFPHFTSLRPFCANFYSEIHIISNTSIFPHAYISRCRDTTVRLVVPIHPGMADHFISACMTMRCSIHEIWPASSLDYLETVSLIHFMLRLQQWIDNLRHRIPGGLHLPEDIPCHG